MKKFRVIAVLVVALCFLLGTTTVYGYGHSLTVSAGNGSFDKSPGKGTVATIDTEAGTVTVGDTTATLTKMPDNEKPADSKYFVTGMKIAGYDNNEGSSYVFTGTIDINGETALDSYKEKDTELVVAYGLKSNMVKYTISYVDQNGAQLLPSETHYGAIGQESVVSYKHVAGYLPDAYNASKTLSANEADNVITFTYNPVQAAEGQTIVNNAGNAAAAGGNAAAGAAAGGNAAAGNAAANAPGTATIGDNQTPQAINDQDTPLAANPDEEEGGPGAFPFIIGGVIAAGIIAAIAAILARRKGDEVE